MTTDDEDRPGADDLPAWKEALERYEHGYGRFDAREWSDVAVLLQMIEEEVHGRLTRRLVESFRAATARIEATGRDLGARVEKERRP
jgi:hypothetical protein